MSDSFLIPKSEWLCKHGSLRRSCEICERDERIKENEDALEALDRMIEERNKAKDDEIARLCAELERADEWEERAIASMNAASKAAGVICCDLIPDAIAEKDSRIAELEEEADKLNQIVMAVERKFHNEQRWETALRYVREREDGFRTSCQQAAAVEVKGE